MAARLASSCATKLGGKVSSCDANGEGQYNRALKKTTTKINSRQDQTRLARNALEIICCLRWGREPLYVSHPNCPRLEIVRLYRMNRKRSITRERHARDARGGEERHRSSHVRIKKAGRGYRKFLMPISGGFSNHPPGSC